MTALDAVIIDLEDAVSVQAKEASREGLSAFLSSLPPSRPHFPRILVRVNCPVTTEYGKQDLASIVAPYTDKLDGLLLPKVESNATIESAAALVSAKLPVWCMIESARGVESAHALAANPLVEGLVFGSNDYAKDIRAQPSSEVGRREPLLFALSRTVNAARAEGKQVVDGVFMDLRDDGTGLEREARQGRALGFDGKSLIHPTQVAVTNRVFSPSAQDVAHAHAVSAAFAAAQREGKGVCVVDGRLIEALHVDQARDTLTLHESLQRRE